MRLDTAENRASAVQAAIARMHELAAGYDSARGRIDDLYGQLAQAAQDKANVERLTGLLSLLQTARGELGPDSDLARHARSVKETAQAFLDLISQA